MAPPYNGNELLPCGREIWTYVGQTDIPAVVPADSQNDVSTALVEGLPEVTSAGTDIEILVMANLTGESKGERGAATYWVPAIAIWSTTAFFLGQLHESLFTTSANDVRLARTLLHGKRG